MKRLSFFFSELFRRKVVRLVGAYIALFWLVVEGYASVYEALGFPAWTLQALIVSGIALAPILAWLSWRYDLVLPRLVRDEVHEAEVSPGKRWALQRHENSTGSYILLGWKDAEGKIHEKRFFKPVAVGRGLMNDVNLGDECVSRNHAVIWAQGDLWRIKDLDSGNGTFVDGVSISGSTTLPQSCELRFDRRGPVVKLSVIAPATTLKSS